MTLTPVEEEKLREMLNKYVKDENRTVYWVSVRGEVVFASFNPYAMQNLYNTLINEFPHPRRQEDMVKFQGRPDLDIKEGRLDMNRETEVEGKKFPYMP